MTVTRQIAARILDEAQELSLFEVRESIVVLSARDEAGRPVNIICGGLEVFAGGRRLEAGGTFFFMNGPDGQVFQEFHDSPYLMLPDEEPDRIEFYFPPSARVFNFPLIFHSMNESRPRTSRQSLVLQGSLLEPARIRIRKQAYSVEYARLSATISLTSEGYTARLFGWTPGEVESPGGLSFLEPKPTLRWFRGFRRHSLFGMTVRGNARRTTIRLPGGRGSDPRYCVTDLPVGRVVTLAVLGTRRWMVLTMLATEAALHRDRDVDVLAVVMGRRAHEVRIVFDASAERDR